MHNVWILSEKSSKITSDNSTSEPSIKRMVICSNFNLTSAKRVSRWNTVESSLVSCRTSRISSSNCKTKHLQTPKIAVQEKKLHLLKPVFQGLVNQAANCFPFLRCWVYQIIRLSFPLCFLLHFLKKYYLYSTEWYRWRIKLKSVCQSHSCEPTEKMLKRNKGNFKSSFNFMKE